MIKGTFSLPLRALQGFIDSIFALMNVPLRAPNYTSISKRSKTVQVKYKNKSKGSVRHIAIDSIGMKVFGEGEWKVKKHGAEKRSVNCIWPLMSIPMMLLAQKSASSMLVIAKLSQHY